MVRKKAKKKRKNSGRKRKPAKILTKRKPIRKKAVRKARRKIATVTARGPKLPTEPIGRVTHYFPKVKAAAIMIERDGIRVGDSLYFKGHTTRFKQAVASLQINHQTVSQASPGDEVGMAVKSRTRQHDLVFKL